MLFSHLDFVVFVGTALELQMSDFGEIAVGVVDHNGDVPDADGATADLFRLLTARHR
jgi:hypothetical protein